jgi:hypothetical protein
LGWLYAQNRTFSETNKALLQAAILSTFHRVKTPITKISKSRFQSIQSGGDLLTKDFALKSEFGNSVVCNKSRATLLKIAPQNIFRHVKTTEHHLESFQSSKTLNFIRKSR